MLRLPGALRAAGASRYYATLLLIPRRSAVSSLDGSYSRVGNRPLLGRVQWRAFATVNADGSDKLWSRLSTQALNNTPGESSGDGESPETPACVPSLELAREQAASTSDSTEQEMLLEIMRKRRKIRPAGQQRRRVSQRINNALESADPVSALRYEVYGRAQRPQQRERQDVKETSRSSEKSSTPKTEAHLNQGRNSGESILESSSAQLTQLMDIEYIRQNTPLPSREQYPAGPADLVSPSMWTMEINNACQHLKLSNRVDAAYSPKRGIDKRFLQKLKPGLQEVFVCNLTLEIEGVFQGSAIGEGFNKASAKSAAWLHLVSKMHVAGALKDLFPEDDVSHAKDGALLSDMKLTELSEETKMEEKDAKTEIYNYAAGFGMVPKFETTLVTRHGRRTRLRRKSPQPKAIWRATIRLDGRGIHASAANENMLTAEIAAVVSFKEQAEKQLISSSCEVGQDELIARRVLNVDTAKDFVDEFYKSRSRSAFIDVEQEEKSEGGVARNFARVTINGKPTGDGVTMRTKSKAESAAYLTAAVEITNANPELLDEYKEALRKGKGKTLRALYPIDLQVEYDSINLMREALIEARDAGLSDFRGLLDAENADRRDELYLSNPPRLSAEELDSANVRLLFEQQKSEGDLTFLDMRTQKASLPMHKYRQDVLKLVSENAKSIIVGATGSGKTTQVPQIIFEDAIRNGSGASCNIICTQPRRIAATSVAHRVAEERNEPLRRTVGYQVRHDAKRLNNPYGITYCTTGVLLEKLKRDFDKTLDTVSHIVIDEVHERDLYVDFLMILLKTGLKRWEADGKSVPKIVLMSATMDVELFGDYFSDQDNNGNYRPCPSLSVPGRTFPVEDKYLSSIMDELQGSYGEAIMTLVNEDLHTKEYLKVENEFSGQFSQRSVIDWKGRQRSPPDPEESTNALQETEDALVPVALVAAAIAHICSISQDGAVLAFLPGREEILAVRRTLLLHEGVFGVNFGDPSKFSMHILHSQTPKQDQAEVFQPCPTGCRKIILSTNIAETSVTVPDVKYVVDCGKIREKRYDQQRRITAMQTVWESKSNAKQRAGRAGRLQDGFYYALFSKERADSLRAVGQAEMLRSDLETTCLSIKAQKFAQPVGSFLAQAIEPPSEKAIQAAIKSLTAIEAFTEDENLTALGRVLSSLPVPPSLGKMIILGVIFRCLDPMIILGSAPEARELFLRPIGARAEAKKAHQMYAGVHHSDHIAFLEAFRELRMLNHTYGPKEVSARSQEKFLHAGAFRMIDLTAKQVERFLVEIGLVERYASDFAGSRSRYGPPDLNRNSNNAELIKYLLLRGLYPNIAAKTSHTGVSYRTPSEQLVVMSPRSLNCEPRAEEKFPKGTVFAFNTLTKSKDGALFLQECTQVTPLMAVLCAGHVSMTSNVRLEIDEWLPLVVTTRDSRYATKMILEFRKALDRVLFRAFKALADLQADGTSKFADDPVCDQFANRMIEILGVEAARRRANSVPVSDPVRAVDHSSTHNPSKITEQLHRILGRSNQ